ncbi:lipopolysaccharide core heptose(II) kinase RfaY [Cladorrhinum sp. PSN259]|nr:lipopolysaccharide core heptose(II) kinase RfaY [Cladorrhinum sp. PSN259]
MDEEFKIVLPVKGRRRPGVPDHYRLSAARLGAIKHEPASTLVHFWFRTRYVSALASELSHLHPHISQLHISPSTVADLIGSCVKFVPTFAQSWVRTALPEWFLPNHLVLKKQKRGDLDRDQEAMVENFDNEVKAYDQLKPLQGVVIPKCFGRLHYHGERALLLQSIEGGVSLSSPEGATLEMEELSTLLQPCYRAIHALGVHHDDPNLANFLLVNGKIMVLDLESAVFGLSARKKAFFLTTCIGQLADHYLDMQEYHHHDGSLEAA